MTRQCGDTHLQPLPWLMPVFCSIATHALSLGRGSAAASTITSAARWRGWSVEGMVIATNPRAFPAGGLDQRVNRRGTRPSPARGCRGAGHWQGLDRGVDLDQPRGVAGGLTVPAPRRLFGYYRVLLCTAGTMLFRCFSRGFA